MIALTQLDKVLRDEPAQLIATVHDEAVLLVPDDLAALERIGAVAQKEMIAAFLEVFPDAPTLGLVDPAVGPTWGDLVPLQQWLAKPETGLACAIPSLCVPRRRTGPSNHCALALGPRLSARMLFFDLRNARPIRPSKSHSAEVKPLAICADPRQRSSE